MDIVIFCGIAWTIAQGLKVFLRYRHYRVWRWSLLWGSGGFPSAHSAFITCLMLQIGYAEGFKTSLFALALGFWAVVIYDSFNVRYAVGLQAQAINALREDLVEGLGDNYTPIPRIPEILGHTPVQVSAGILLGALVAFIRIGMAMMLHG